jgi:hypothetical protein
LVRTRSAERLSDDQPELRAKVVANVVLARVSDRIKASAALLAEDGSVDVLGERW